MPYFVLMLFSAEMKNLFCIEAAEWSILVERRPAALKAWFQTMGWEPKNFQNWLSSAETQQPFNWMRHKA